MIKVLFFGPVADLIGRRTIEVEHRTGMRLQELRDELYAKYPEAFGLVAMTDVDGMQVRDMVRTLDDGSDVAFMSKFSGG